MSEVNRVIIGEREQAGWPISAPVFNDKEETSWPNMRWVKREDSTFELQYYNRGWEPVPLMTEKGGQ